MVNTEIRLIIFAAEDGETLYSRQKQDQELTVAQIMNSLWVLKKKKTNKTPQSMCFQNVYWKGGWQHIF